jgi:(S)-2-hydroxyglutarate dehydrogenase
VADNCDVLILGAGIVGLSTGIAILESNPELKVVIAEKELQLALHASGRNSGVLHAGFYYSAQSLKARFCREGNLELRKLAKKYSIPVIEVGKVVVTQNKDELIPLNTLFERGISNGVDLELLEANELSQYEPLASTHEKFLWSPTTAISDPKQIIHGMFQEFLRLGGKVDFNKSIELAVAGDEVYDKSYNYNPKHIVNASGAHADRISRQIGVGTDYAMLPFMGVYRFTEHKNLPLKRLVYPVPHPINPFLGVHFTLTLDHKVKIGPTAIPVAGREQYSLLEGWSADDIGQAWKGMISLVRGEAHDFSAMIKTEWPKVIQSMLVKESSNLVPTAITVREWKRKPPGIRAQLVHLPSGKLEQDFVVRSVANCTHILNAVSPGWTSAIPFGRWVGDEVINLLN